MNTKAKEIAVFGGGCFWCTEAIFENLEGVDLVKPGYSGGNYPNPTYEDVCSGETGHAEVIYIEFDPQKIGYEKLLEVFFLTHDPTTLNKQGADVGTQYRSVIFFNGEEQQQKAVKMISDLKTQKKYSNPIVTEVVPLKQFYEAENYHHNYFSRNKNQPYCRFVIQSKVSKFSTSFPDLLKKQ